MENVLTALGNKAATNVNDTDSMLKLTQSALNLAHVKANLTHTRLQVEETGKKTKKGAGGTAGS
jgi:hypothetical protein